VPNPALLVASSDEHFREMVRDSLLNVPNAKVVGEYQEVRQPYIRPPDLSGIPRPASMVDIRDPEGSIKAIEKVKQAAPIRDHQPLSCRW
jgi:hypothetical protein